MAPDENTVAATVDKSGSSNTEAYERQGAQPWPHCPSRLRRLFQNWTFSYMSHILHKRARRSSSSLREQPLTIEDLFRIPPYMEANRLSRQFNQTFHGTAEKTAVAPPHRRLLYALWHLAKSTFVPAGFCQLLTVLCQVALPLMVRALLQVLEEFPQEAVVQQGLPYVLSIFGIAVINAFGSHRHRHLAMQSGIILKAATVNALYEHVLKLSPRGKAGLVSGEVTNLVAVDTQKLFEVCQEGHMVWSLPLSIVLVTVCLLVVMGPTTMVGVAVLILFVPLVERITSRMLAIRRMRVKMTDDRVGVVNGMLQGMKVTKLNSYEERYEQRVSEARRNELLYLRRELAVWALTLVLTVISPMMATSTTFTVYIFLDDDNVLTASRSFSVLLLFSALRFPINHAGRLLGKATQAYSALQRISAFLERPIRNNDIIKEKSKGLDNCGVLRLRNAIFYHGELPQIGVDQDELAIPSFAVSLFNFDVKAGEVLAVCGPVGGGKSSLINGIVGQIAASPETVVESNGSISLVGQNAFILNATLRENILFGLPFHSTTYDAVLDACCLRSDIALLGPAKDFTEIGERGVTLSGGQKQRISLARAAYRCCNEERKFSCVLMDDPLSALDQRTSKRIFEGLIKGPNALLSRAAIVLVTHASHFLNRVDKIMVLVNGDQKFLGTFKELLLHEGGDDDAIRAIDFIRSAVQQEKVDNDRSTTPATELETKNIEVGKEDLGALMTVEQREHGLSSLKIWLLWFDRAGGTFFLFFQVLFMSIDRFAYVAVEYWLARWTTAATESITVFGVAFDPQSDGRTAQYRYLTVFASLIVVSVLATVLRSEWSVTGGSRAARRVFSSMLSRILGAPMSYFESTPSGRLLNRFTYDMEVVDVTLTQNMSLFMISISWFVAGFAIIISILPHAAFIMVLTTTSYWFLLLHYRKSGTDLQRLDAVSRSPVQAMVSEGLDGSVAIRLFEQQRNFLHKFRLLVDVSSSALLNYITAQRWLGLRIELLGSLIVLFVSLVVICLNDKLRLDAGLVGLLVMWSSNATITLGFLVETFSEAEAAITAIERVHAMSKIEQEKSRITTGDYPVSTTWPENGTLIFRDVCMRYRPNLPLTLSHVSFKVPGGTRCGIVGRTGAGKSSIAVALFRIAEIEHGTILVDGVDLSRVGLSDVRGRPNGMVIIPQDPFLIGQTLRQCIDPFSQSNDDAILEAVKAVRIANPSDTLSCLDMPLEEGGSNYSVGERQLLNLARALLSKPKVLMLDESTANLDGATDAFIQTMLRTRFHGTTQITIAHRLNTIMDFDMVVCMDQGQVAEIGRPQELLLSPNGVFSELVDSTGAESSKALRKLVRKV